MSPRSLVPWFTAALVAAGCHVQVTPGPHGSDPARGAPAATATPPESPPPRGPLALSVQTGPEFHPAEIAWSADGRTLLTLSGDAQKLWDLRSNLLIRSARVSYGTIALHPRGTRLVGTTDKGTKLHLVDLATMERVKTIEAVGFTTATFSPDGKLVAAGTSDGHVVLLSGEDGSALGTLAPPGAAKTSSGVVELAFDPAGGRLAVATGERVQLYDVPSRAPRCTVTLKSDDILFASGLSLRSVVFAPTGADVAVSRNDGTNAVWDVGACVQKASFVTPQTQLSESQHRPEYTLKLLGYLPGGKEILAVGNTDYTGLMRWNLTTGAVAQYIPYKLDLVRAALSPDGRLIAVSDRANKLVLYDAVRAVSLGPIGPSAVLPVPLAIDEAKDQLFVVDDRAKSVDVLDLRQATKVRSIPLPQPSSPHAVAMDPSAHILAHVRRSVRKTAARSFDDETLALLDVASGQDRELEALLDGGVAEVAFSEDGAVLVAAIWDSSKYHLRAYDVPTGRRLWDVEGVHEPSKLTPRRRGNVLLTVEGKSVVVVRDLATGRARGELRPSPKTPTHRSVASVALSPDARRVVTTGTRGDVSVWDLATRALRTKPSEPGEAYAEPVAYYAGPAELVVVDNDGEAQTLDATTLRESSRGRAHDGRALRAMSSKTGRWRVSLGIDLTLQVSRREGEAKGTVQIVRSPSGEYVFVAPGNAYLASKSALGTIAFRIGTRAYPFDSFDAVINRPEAVLTELGAGARAVASARELTARRHRRLGIDPTRKGEDEVPDVTIKTTDLPVRTSARTMPLQVRANAWSSELDRVEVYVNEVPAGVVALRDRHVRAADVPLEVVLGAGPNRVQVSAFNARGLESLRETISVTLDAPASKPDLRVIVVGVSKYKVGRLDLDYAAKDAHDVAAFFKAHAGRFGAVRVVELVDADATRAGLVGLKTELAAAKVDDQVVLFLAGHGFLGLGDEYFFAPHDLDPKDAKAAAASGVPFADLEQLLRASPARRKLLLMDTCHSGEADDGPSAPLAPDVKVRTRGLVLETGVALGERVSLRDSTSLLAETFADVRRGSGAVVLSSAAGKELALEAGAQRNGLFTFALLEGLTTGRADGDKDGSVRVSELREYVTRRVTTLSGGQQHPTARRENVVLDFEVF